MEHLAQTREIGVHFGGIVTSIHGVRGQAFLPPAPNKFQLIRVKSLHKLIEEARRDGWRISGVLIASKED